MNVPGPAPQCPDCSVPLVPNVAACHRCGLPLTGATANRLGQVVSRIQRLERDLYALHALYAQREALLGELRSARDAITAERLRAARHPAAPVHTPPPAGQAPWGPAPGPTRPATGRSATPVPPPAPNVRREVSARSAQNVLLGLGGLLITVAAVVFTIVTWSDLGIGMRALVLGGATALTAAAALPLHRRGMGATAETVGVLAGALLCLDALAVWLVADIPVPLTGYAAGALAVVCVLLAGYPRLVPLRGPRVLAVLLVQPIPLLLGLALRPGWEIVPLALAVTVLGTVLARPALRSPDLVPLARVLTVLVWIGAVLSAVLLALVGFALSAWSGVVGANAYWSAAALALAGVAALLDTRSTVAAWTRAASGAAATLALLLVPPAVLDGAGAAPVWALLAFAMGATVATGIAARLPRAHRAGPRVVVTAALTGAALAGAVSAVSLVNLLGPVVGPWRGPVALVVLPDPWALGLLLTLAVSGAGAVMVTASLRRGWAVPVAVGVAALVGAVAGQRLGVGGSVAVPAGIAVALMALALFSLPAPRRQTVPAGPVPPGAPRDTRRWGPLARHRTAGTALSLSLALGTLAVCGSLAARELAVATVGSLTVAVLVGAVVATLVGAGAAVRLTYSTVAVLMAAGSVVAAGALWPVPAAVIVAALLAVGAATVAAATWLDRWGGRGGQVAALDGALAVPLVAAVAEAARVGWAAAAIALAVAVLPVLVVTAHRRSLGGAARYGGGAVAVLALAGTGLLCLPLLGEALLGPFAQFTAVWRGSVGPLFPGQPAVGLTTAVGLGVAAVLAWSVPARRTARGGAALVGAATLAALVAAAWLPGTLSPVGLTAVAAALLALAVLADRTRTVDKSTEVPLRANRDPGSAPQARTPSNAPGAHFPGRPVAPPAPPHSPWAGPSGAFAPPTGGQHPPGHPVERRLPGAPAHPFHGGPWGAAPPAPRHHPWASPERGRPGPQGGPPAGFLPQPPPPGGPGTPVARGALRRLLDRLTGGAPAPIAPRHQLHGPLPSGAAFAPDRASLGTTGRLARRVPRTGVRRGVSRTAPSVPGPRAGEPDRRPRAAVTATALSLAAGVGVLAAASALTGPGVTIAVLGVLTACAAVAAALAASPAVRAATATAGVLLLTALMAAALVAGNATPVAAALAMSAVTAIAVGCATGAARRGGRGAQAVALDAAALVPLVTAAVWALAAGRDAVSLVVALGALLALVAATHWPRRREASTALTVLAGVLVASSLVLVGDRLLATLLGPVTVAREAWSPAWTRWATLPVAEVGTAGAPALFLSACAVALTALALCAGLNRGRGSVLATATAAAGVFVPVLVAQLPVPPVPALAAVVCAAGLLLLRAARGFGADAHVLAWTGTFVAALAAGWALATPPRTILVLVAIGVFALVSTLVAAVRTRTSAPTAARLLAFVAGLAPAMAILAGYAALPHAGIAADQRWLPFVGLAVAAALAGVALATTEVSRRGVGRWPRSALAPNASAAREWAAPRTSARPAPGRGERRGGLIGASLATVLAASLCTTVAPESLGLVAALSALLLFALSPAVPRAAGWTLTGFGGLALAVAVATVAGRVGVVLFAPYAWAGVAWTGTGPGGLLVPAADAVAPWGGVAVEPLLLPTVTAAALAVLALVRTRAPKLLAATALALATPVLVPYAVATGAAYGMALGWVLMVATALAGVAALAHGPRLAAGAGAAALWPASLAVAWGLAEPVATPVVLGLLAAVAATCLAVAERPRAERPTVFVRGTAATTVLALGGFALALPLLLEQSAQVAALAMLLVVAGVVLAPYLARVDAPALLAAECAATALGTAAVLLTLVGGGRPELTSAALACLGVLAAAGAPRQGRAWLGAVGGVLLLASGWVFLGWLGVAEPEPYTAVPALVALLAGWEWRRRRPGTGTWLAYGPGLALLFLPGLAMAYLLDGAEPWRTALLGGGAVAVTLAGARWRLQAPLLVGAAALVLIAGRAGGSPLWQTVLILPNWIPLGAAGLLLLAVGARYERRLRDLRRLGRLLRDME